MATFKIAFERSCASRWTPMTWRSRLIFAANSICVHRWTDCRYYSYYS